MYCRDAKTKDRLGTVWRQGTSNRWCVIGWQRKKWKEAIEKHSLSWTHLGNKEGQRQYHVRAIPKLILINGEGIIEAVDLRSDDLLEKLQDIYEPM